jgi:hypothetical protein
MIKKNKRKIYFNCKSRNQYQKKRIEKINFDYKIKKPKNQLKKKENKIKNKK